MFGFGLGSAIGQAIAGGGAVSASEFTTPADFSIFTVSTANAITLDQDAEVFADGVSIGETTAKSLSWTPGAVDLDVTLTAGDADPLTLAVADANGLSQTLTGWSATNVTMTGSQTDPDGGSTAYRMTCSATASAQHYITATASPAMANNYTSGEFWFKPGTETHVGIRQTAVVQHEAWYELATGQANCNRASLKVVESRPDGWKRFWWRMQDDTAANSKASAVRLYLTDNFSSNSVTAGTETGFFWKPRMVDGPLPLTPYMQCGFRRNGSTAYKAETWIVTTPWNRGMDDMAVTNVQVDVLLPTTYDPGNSYKVVHLMPVEQDRGSSLNNELEEIEALGLHDSMDCIFVRAAYYQTRTWGGIKTDTTRNHDNFISKMLVEFVDEFYSTVGTAASRCIMGYSAGGFAAFAQFQRYPDVWGYCIAWDSPWAVAYGTYDEADHFGSEAQYNAFNPYQQLAATKTGYSDSCRLIIGGSATFDASTQAMFTALTTELGASKNGTGDYDTTITNAAGKWWRVYKDQSGIGAPAHNFLSEWVTPALSALEGLW